MATKSSDRGGGPGTFNRGGVRSTMDPCYPKGSNTGSQGTMPGPFDQSRSGGANGLPTKTFDNMGGPSKGASANQRDVPGTILTNPKADRANNR